MSIDVRVNGDVEKAIRVLKRKVQRDGLQKELRRRRFHEKPSIKKKRKQAEAAKRKRKKY